MDKKEIVARRIAQEMTPGVTVNLGIGLPGMVADYIPDGVEVFLQSENGFLGMGPCPPAGLEDKDLVNAGNKPVTLLPGAACFDSAFSFALIRGGHLDYTVLGALEVDQEGNLANWIVPGKLVPGMGGAMDLVVGAKKVIIGMEHTTKDGKPKILKKCTLPLTAAKEVNLIVTEMGVIEVTPQGLVLTEIASGLTVKDVQDATEAELKVSPSLKTMSLENRKAA